MPDDDEPLDPVDPATPDDFAATIQQIATRDQPLDARATLELTRVQEHVKEVQWVGRMRPIFFYLAMGIMVVCTAAPIIPLWVLAFKGIDGGSGVIAFAGGLAVQSIGLAAVIARYLFPNGGPKDK